MVTAASLLSTPPSEVTFDRVRALVETTQPESLTLEFKEKFSTGLVDSIAAMANSYGGLVLIGVKDIPGHDRISGVSESTVTQIVNACHETLEPPWQPEIVPVSLPNDPTRLVLVIRVHADRAPRPILIKGAAKIRLHGRNATADRTRLAQLFAETHNPAAATRPFATRAQIPTDLDGTPNADFMLRTSLFVAVDPAMSWRPLSDQAVDVLGEALNTSPLHAQLLRWLSYLGMDGFSPFHRQGLNRARRARLVWDSQTGSGPLRPVESILQAEMPDTVGAPVSHMQITLDVLVRASALMTEQMPEETSNGWRLSVPDLYETIEAVLSTVVDRPVVEALAGLTGIDPVLVPQPSTFDFVTAANVEDLLGPHGLRPIPDAGSSHGANLWTDPSFDLLDATDRAAQLDLWIQQIGSDAGLRGMEAVLAEYHRAKLGSSPG
jgi:hypothetical protein